jgi:hypothetical protein
VIEMTIERFKVTADNLDEAKDACRANDQRKELEIGDETWGITYDGGQRGQMSRYNKSGRGAVCFGGDSLWGDWTITGNLSLLAIDDGENLVDEQGNMMTKTEMGEAFESLMIEAN